jgi:hypothetical protein
MNHFLTGLHFMQTTELKTHLLFLGTLTIILIIPLALIILSYTSVISGTADYVIAFAVIASFVYIIGGGIYSFIQDSRDGKKYGENV